ncbi:Mechanosensitive ion channel [compost metagenome]
MAWSGLLANLAAGGFIIVLRPFKVGDIITAGGVTGMVKEIGLFATAINTPDNVLTLVGNNKIFGDNIQNYSHNPFRRVELKAQLSGAADYQAAVTLLKQRIAAIPNVLEEPAVDVEILEFNLLGPVLGCVRTATTTTTGRCISIPTAPSRTRSAPTSRRRCRRKR